MTAGFPLFLGVLGVGITLQFSAERAADQAASMFAALVVDPWRSPDMVITCDWPELDRRFIRSRPSTEVPSLEGIRVFSAEDPDGAEWNSLDPPFPPVDLAPFRHRFARLHAGAVVDDRGRVLLILGETGLGKSTLCTELVTNHGYLLLTDEDAFLHIRTGIVEPFAVGCGLRKKGLGQFVQHLPIGEPGIVDNIVVLSPPGRASATLVDIDQRRCLTALLMSQRPSGADHAQVIATLSGLARAARAKELSGGQYDELLAAASDVAAFGRRSAARVDDQTNKAATKQTKQLGDYGDGIRSTLLD